MIILKALRLLQRQLKFVADMIWGAIGMLVILGLVFGYLNIGCQQNLFGTSAHCAITTTFPVFWK